jgi:hypothetical protein
MTTSTVYSITLCTAVVSTNEKDIAKPTDNADNLSGPQIIARISDQAPSTCPIGDVCSVQSLSFLLARPLESC